jgi:hypothetical protein
VAQDRAPVPGEVDAHVTQATIPSTICQPGYTAKVRPPRKFTDSDALTDFLRQTGVPIPEIESRSHQSEASSTSEA